MTSGTAGKPRRILLSGVFGPFGVDDAWGRRENIMELFHNQVTKAQGEASFRFHHRSFGLYFLAENVDADVTVLDFPSRERYVRELGKGYDLVGISFIAPNFAKARDMARLVRILAPEARIVLGGHGAAIEGIESLIDCDDVVRGEGIRGLREILGQDPGAPVVHPVLPSTERQSILGIPLLGRSANLLVPGVGCVNACRFCSTSHFFGKAYRPFLGTGRELFETARAIADRTGTDDFFVMDENFLKDTGRALALLGEMERNRRYFGFQLFSSAEAIRAFGLDNMVRLGVSFVWIGVESATRSGNYAKNEGVDARLLTRELRDRGITVLASGILCAEHHTPGNIQAEIDFMVGLEADMVQFMLLTPLPVTALYRDMQQKGLLRENLPFEEWHGQKELSWNHPAFPGDAPARWLEKAFRADYEANSSTMYRVIETAFRGWKRLAALPRRDACLEEMRAACPELKVVVIDIHAEATSEKQATGWWFDGRASLVIGTHTHVPTADARVLPKGTAYQGDAGMTGAYEGIIGFDPKNILERFRFQTPRGMETATRDVRLCGAVVDVDEATGRARSIVPIQEKVGT